ncbi:hypothetical protein IJ425_06360 [bacterium]|nr:hypothetical protein [bacterium]
MDKEISMDRCGKFIVLAYNFFLPFVIWISFAVKIEDFSKNVLFVLITLCLAIWGTVIFLKDTSRKILISENELTIYEYRNKKVNVLLRIPSAEIQNIKQGKYFKILLEKKDGTNITLPPMTGFTFCSALLSIPYLVWGYISKLLLFVHKIRLNFNLITDEKEKKSLRRNEIIANVIGIICSLFIIIIGLFAIYSIILCAQTNFQIDMYKI